MLNPLPTIFPTMSGPRRGRILALRENAPAIVLIDRAPGHSDVGVTLTELSYYLRDAGLSVVRTAVSDGERDAGDWASTLLGVVSFVRSLGASRVALVQATDFETPAPRDPVDAVVELVELMKRNVAAGDVGQAVVSLTAAIRLVADSVVGMATLVSPVARASSPPRVAVSAHRAAHSKAYPIFTLGDGESVMPLISQLYGWAVDFTSEARLETRRAGTRRIARPSVAIRSSLGATWNERIKWLAEQWEELLDSLDRRAPELARRARDAGPTPSALTDERWMVIHRARAAWGHLDDAARRDWLTLCSLAFAEMLDTTVMLADTATRLWAVRGTRDQRYASGSPR
jgi:hypothetical protein